ncbi:hypothetical protein PENSPDRAFT_370813 [Peniophora sp. CONT]|nr:hypothetical protein PENSPDRAFT_370813 [Peniophora sp. CONT]
MLCYRCQCGLSACLCAMHIRRRCCTVRKNVSRDGLPGLDELLVCEDLVHGLRQP